MAERCVQHLLQDHRQCEQVLAALEALLDALQADPQWTSARGKAFARIICFFDQGQTSHLRKEDEVLFPALEGFLPRDVGPLAVLRGEHADLCANLRCWREAGESLSKGIYPPPVLEDFQRYGRTTIRILRDHIYKEDRVLFPMVARFLSPQRDEHLLRQMEAIGPPISTPICRERVD